MKLPSPAWLLLALALAPRAAAQDPQEVLAEFKKQVKLPVKECKSSMAGLAAALQTEMDIFVLGFEQLASDDGPVDDFAEALIAYQKAARLIVDDACDDIGAAAGAALAQLTPAGPDENVFPVGLLVGDGGALDDALAQVAQAAVKANASIAKKLAKLAKKLRSKTDMRLTLLLPPQPVRQIVPSSGGFGGGTTSSLFIDVLLSFNRGGDDDDGRVWVSGECGIDEGDVVILITGPSIVNDSAAPDGVDGRWSFATDVQTDPLEEGGYFVIARQGTGALASRTIGLP